MADHKNSSEALPIFPSVDPFVGQTIIRSGTIKNLAFPNDEPLEHVYELETRQSKVNNTRKDVFTKLKLGIQNKHRPFTNTEEYPGGTIFEWTQKRSDQGARLERYGLLGPSRVESGELYRHNVVHGFDHVLREGEGYEYNFPDERATHQLMESFGTINDGSVYRKRIHGPNTSVTKVLADDQYKIDVKIGEAEYNLKFTENGLTISTNGTDKYIKLGGSGNELELATKEFVEDVYDAHTHGTGVGPSSPPLLNAQAQAIAGGASNYLTTVTKSD